MTSRQKGMLALAITLLAWSLTGLFVKYLLVQGYDAHTQNFYRYAAGTLVVLPFAFIRLRQRGVRLTGRQMVRLIGPALPNLGHQIGFVVALQWILPGLVSFLNKSSVLFAALMAFALFPEERWLARSRRFVAGLTLTLFGAAGLALLRSDVGELQANLAVLLVLGSAACWALYSVSVKRLVQELGSTVTFGIVGLYTTLVLFGPAVVWGDLGHWRAVPWHVNAILIGSGFFCIGLAHTCYYYALRTLSVSVCTVMLLTTPLGTLVISQAMFGERFTPGQIVSGALLLVGGALTLLAKERPVPLEVARAVEEQ